MFKKALLATSALVVASSMAFAASHQPTHAQQLAAKKAIQHTQSKHMPGVVFAHNGAPVAVKFQMSSLKPGAHGTPGRLVTGKSYSTLSKSKNALFLSYFGWFAGGNTLNINSSYSYCQSYNSSYTQCLNYRHIHETVTSSFNDSAAQPFTGVTTASSISFGAEQYSGTGGSYKVGIYKDNSGIPGAAVAGASGTFGPLASFNGLCCAGLETVSFAPVSLSKKKQYWVVMSGNGGVGRMVWNGQDSNFTAPPTGEDFNSHGLYKYKDTYRTSRSGHTSVFSGSETEGTNGWIHTSSFSFGEQQAAFAIN